MSEDMRRTYEIFHDVVMRQTHEYFQKEVSKLTIKDRTLAPVQARLLRLLDPENPTNQQVLADLLGCDKSNITGVVDRLEALGLVERKPSAEDRRSNVVLLTKQGLAIRAKVIELLYTPPQAFMELSPEDQKALAALAETMFPHTIGCPSK